jgi:hypothetical protein
MRAAACLHIEGFDGMRFLGADPRTPADDIEQLVMLHLQKRVVGMKNRALKEAMRRGR